MLANVTSVIRGRKRSDHELAGLDVPHFSTDIFDDATVLVAHGCWLSNGLNSTIGPEIRSANTCGPKANDGICWFDNLRGLALLKAHIAWSIENSSSHDPPPLSISLVLTFGLALEMRLGTIPFRLPYVRCPPGGIELAEHANLLARCAKKNNSSAETLSQLNSGGGTAHVDSQVSQS